MEKHCPSCQKAFACTKVCWCSAFPPILPLEENGSCLCPACLAQKIKEHIAIKMQALDPDSIRQIQQLGKPSSLIEGIDYTINDQGFFVFSAWYLLRQGKCCGNGCTNCPYQNLKKV